MSSPFFIVDEPLREEKIKKRAEEEALRRQSLLESLPACGGTYKISFPSGYTYCGHSNNIRDRVRRILADLFPPKQTLAARPYNSRVPKWCRAAIAENNLKSVDDLIVEVLDVVEK